MLLETGSDSFRNAAISYESSFNPRTTARDQVNDTALESLRALPSLLQEALCNQAEEFFICTAALLDNHDSDAFATLIRRVRDDYANEQVEALVDDAGISINAAIKRLLDTFS